MIPNYLKRELNSKLKDGYLMGTSFKKKRKDFSLYMKLNFLPVFFIAIIYHLAFTENLSAQDWNFIKERDGIKIYTRIEESTALKSFKGEADLKTDMEKISKVIEKIESYELWNDDISEIKVLGYEKDKYIRYYLVYDVQWPFEDRDLCVEALVTSDPVTGIRTIHATPLMGVVPEKPDMVRITNYWQEWKIEPAGNGIIHVTLEGSVDPGGSIPTWLINLVITDTPLKIIMQVQQQVELK